MSLAIKAGHQEALSLGGLKAGQTYTLSVTLESGRLQPDDRLTVELSGAGTDRFVKELHAGDPDLYLPYRPARDGQAKLMLARKPGAGDSALPVRVEWREMTLPDSDRAAIEAEPNDSWRRPTSCGSAATCTARPMTSTTSKTPAKGNRGSTGSDSRSPIEKPILVYFQLDLLDRDVSANLRVYTVDPKTGRPEPYLNGKDPMEIVHDRERERYSKHISRTFTRGTYYLEVNANHPDYILRTRVLPVPPYDEPSQAVEAGMHYIMNVGDAWFAQVPREGNIYVRAANMHDTATRCTACHPSSFSTEANLVAHRNGYPIRSKSNFQYVIDRLYNSITPLYGDDGLYWQRFIAIPLQAQGKQGGILLDFEREVSGQETKTIERFGPFLQRAWESRQDLPPDELNGVIPLDSKFGFAWRDWRVLSRAGRPDPARRLRQIGGQHRGDPGRAGGRPASRDPPGSDPPAVRLVADRQDEACQQDQARNRRTACSSKRRRRLARGRLRPGPERGLHDRAACLDAAADRPAPRPSGPGQGTALPAGPAARLRRLVSDHHARELPHADARDALCRDGAGRGVSPAGSARARLGQPRRRPGALAPHRFAGPHPRRSRKPLGRPRARIGLDSPEPSHRCSITPSRWSERRPRPASAGWGRPSRPPPWSAGSTIRPRSSGARPPGPCGDWVTRGSAWTRSPRHSRTRTRGPAAGPPGSSPISSTAWIPGSTWPSR